MYHLIGPDGKPYDSETPGKFGGHRRLKIYGRLDCPSALSHIAKGEYVQYRVFFADERTAIAAGYRPCGICMKEHYRLWKENVFMEHALEVRLAVSNGKICDVTLADGRILALTTDMIDDPSLTEYIESGVEESYAAIQGDLCIIDLTAEEGQWGRTIVWDYARGEVVHLTSTPYVQRSIVVEDQVVSSYWVSFWGHPADYQYSVAPLKLVDLAYEPETRPLDISIPDGAEPDCCEVRDVDGKIEFQAMGQTVHVSI